MNPIVKIIVTFEYLINGWQVELGYSNGRIFNYTEAQFESKIKNQLQDKLSEISSDWLMNMDEDDIDEEEFDEDDFLENPSDYVEQYPIIEGICQYLCIKEQDVEFEFKYSSDC